MFKNLDAKTVSKTVLLNAGKCLLCILIWTFLWSYACDLTWKLGIVRQEGSFGALLLASLVAILLSALLRFKWYTYLISVLPTAWFILLCRFVSDIFLQSSSQAVRWIGNGIGKGVVSMGIVEQPVSEFFSIGVKAHLYAFEMLAIQLVGYALVLLLVYLAKKGQSRLKARKVAKSE